MKTDISRYFPTTIFLYNRYVVPFFRNRLRDAQRPYNRLYRFFFPPTPLGEHGELNINLGCGDTIHPQFVNVDWFPGPDIHYLRQIDRLPYLKTSSVDLLYASHCLEHFSFVRTAEILAEWFRVIKPGGRLRLSVPDFDKLLNIYEDQDHDVHSIMKQLMGGQTYSLNYHYTIFTRSYLTGLLKDAGFVTVSSWDLDANPLFCDDMSSYCKKIDGVTYPVCLNLDAVKPYDLQ